MTCGNFSATLWTSCPLDHVTQLHDRSPVKPQMWHDKDTLKVTLLPNLGSFFTGFGKTSAVYLWTHTLASNCFQSLESFSVSLLSTHCWVWSAFFWSFTFITALVFHCFHFFISSNWKITWALMNCFLSGNSGRDDKWKKKQSFHNQGQQRRKWTRFFVLGHFQLLFSFFF